MDSLTEQEEGAVAGTRTSPQGHPEAPVIFKKKKRRRGAEDTLRAQSTDELSNNQPKVEEPTGGDGDEEKDLEEDEAAPSAEEVQSAVRQKKKKKLESIFIVSTAKKKAKMEEGVKSDRTAQLDTRAKDAMTVALTKQERDDTKPKWYGPQKEVGNVRAYSRFDYQPDLCKDYNETGYCGYGDACKFMHDRGDYKSGWQLEKEWEEEQAKKMARIRGEDVSDEEDYEIHSDEDLPYACLICHEDFKDPVVTKCEHYFCEKCALQHYGKSSKCYVCNQQTHGIFNTASKVIKHEDSLKKRKREAAAAAAAEDEEREQLEEDEPQET